MTKRMLIDASHAEETRVVVLDGTRLEEFDLEAATKRPLKGNIYLAKVVRVEPSLQAAFVEYGGNRHGFLAFSEIHPDYYQIPVADRQRLIEMQAAEAREEEESEEREAALADALEAAADASPEPTISPADAMALLAEAPPPEASVTEASATEAMPIEATPTEAVFTEAAPGGEVPAEPAVDGGPITEATAPGEGDQPDFGHAPAIESANDRADDRTDEERAEDAAAAEDDGPAPETIGGEGPEEMSRERRIPPRFLRHYKIQEVMRRRQILLVQVVKEERGTKGAALTTYISLAGRFSVLMPNSPRGGGVSRKITSATDRRRLREVIDELSLPQGMSLIVRTAGAQRPKPEIRRDCEYLLRLWDNIRDRTMASSAPALIYEEADLIKRSIRDVYARDVEEILVDGEEAFQEAREFMRMLMPQHAKKIQLFRDGGLFARHQVEAQLDAMHSPMVQLRSGGYLVINQTEALVAIDVNSGRSTRERHIEDTALRTNLEAADEIARQLRLRDLAGLIVIDFIDMESARNDAQVERRVKEALKHDRARIQVGRISHFGLLEMSRQRLRPSLTETTFVTCPHCQGRGQVRSLESSALQVLRAIEEEGAKRRAAEICIHVAAPVALYLLNRKRDKLQVIEGRFGMSVVFEPDDTLLPPNFRLERLRAADPTRVIETAALPAALRMDYAPEPEEPEVEDLPDIEEAPEPAQGETARGEAANGAARGDAAAAAEAERQGRRRRRRRRGGQRTEGGAPNGRAEGESEGEDDQDGEEDEAEATPATASPAGAEAAPSPTGEDAGEAEGSGEAPGEAPGENQGDAPGDSEGEAGRDGPRRRRRGRRGGRPGVAPRDGAEPGPEPAARHAEQPRYVEAPRYMGPTPADPFAGHVDDIMAAMEAAEAAAEAAAERRSRPLPPVVVVVPVAVTEATVAEAAPEVAPAGAVVLEASVVEAVVVEAAVAEAPAAVVPAEATPATVAPVPDEPPAAAIPAEATAPEAASPQPAAVEPAAVEPIAVEPVAPTPADVAPVAAELVVPAPEPIASEVVQGPAVVPVSVDALDEAAPRRRGWWKR